MLDQFLSEKQCESQLVATIKKIDECSVDSTDLDYLQDQESEIEEDVLKRPVNDIEEPRKFLISFIIVSKEYYKTSVVTHIVMTRLDSNSPFRFLY